MQWTNVEALRGLDLYKDLQEGCESLLQFLMSVSVSFALRLRWTRYTKDDVVQPEHL